MDWKVVPPHAEAALLRRRILVLCFWAVPVLLIYALYTDFIPTADWLSWGLIPSLAFAAIASLLLYWRLMNGRAHFALETPRLVRVLTVLLAPMLLFVCCLILLVYGVGDLQVRFFGEPRIVTVTLEKQYGHSRRSCHYRLKGEELKRALHRHLCVESERYETLPTRAPYALVGRASSLGLHIDEIRTSSGERIFSPLEAWLR